MSNDTQIAVVTGSGGGIGRTVAHRLAKRGHPVALLDIDEEPIRVLAEEIREGGGEASWHVVDVTSREDVSGCLDRVSDEWHTPSLGVAASGVIRTQPFLQLDDASWDRTLDINLKGTFIILQEFARRLDIAAEPGAFVAVSSVAGRGPRPDSADYAASKAGVISLVRSAAVALASNAIRVNAVCPGVVDTAMTKAIHELRAREAGISPAESLEGLTSTIPLGRISSTDEVADAILYLLSDAASYVTGQSLNVDGGLEFD